MPTRACCCRTLRSRQRVITSSARAAYVPRVCSYAVQHVPRSVSEWKHYGTVARLRVTTLFCVHSPHSSGFPYMDCQKKLGECDGLRCDVYLDHANRSR